HILSSVTLFTLLHSVFFFHCVPPHRDLHSFPTRRSSDLEERREGDLEFHPGEMLPEALVDAVTESDVTARIAVDVEHVHRDTGRSEEHTSELQSPYDLVCRLLLEKKKQEKKNDDKTCQHT